MKLQKTTVVNSAQSHTHWHIIDASGRSLGRVASQAAQILRGKHKPGFTYNLDSGDFAVIINASQVRFTGKKETQKQYHRHTGYPGGLKSATFEKRWEKDPQQLMREVVEGMLPKNSLGRVQIARLRVYLQKDHPHPIN